MGKLYDLLNTLIGKVNNSVKVEAQTLTDAQKEQARKNIGAAAEGEGGGSTEGAVLYTEQTLTEDQKTQARANIGAASKDIIVSEGGDTLTWTAITEADVDASKMVADEMYPVSDAKVTLGDLAQGGIVAALDTGEELPFQADACEELAPGCIFVAGIFMAITEDNTAVEIDGTVDVFPKAGIYFPADLLFIDWSLTIPGYTGFATEKLNPKLMPSWNDIKNRPFGETYTVLYEGTNLEPMEDEGAYIAILPRFDIVEGQAYSVVIDGVEYSTKGGLVSGVIPFIGNSAYTGAGEDDGSPYICMLDVDSGEGMLFAMFSPFTSIHITMNAVTKIDQKYIPNSAVFLGFDYYKGGATKYLEDAENNVVTRSELKRLYYLGHPVYVRYGFNVHTPIMALIEGLENHGFLEIIKEDGTRERLYTAEYTPPAT